MNATLTPAPSAFDLWSLRRRGARSATLLNVVAILAGSVFVALSAQLEFRLPFSIVPVTAQTLAVLMVGGLLGARKGAASLALYLAEGAVGLPVFAGGSLGLATVLGPTGGYLIGFIAAAYVAGLICERGFDLSLPKAVVALLAAHTLIFVFGVGQLSLFIGFNAAFAQGYLPFIGGEVIKSVLAAGFLRSARRLA